jgi:hypothetical protein
LFLQPTMDFSRVTKNEYWIFKICKLEGDHVGDWDIRQGGKIKVDLD